MAETMYCQINNTIARVFHDHVTKRSGLIAGARDLQNRLTKELVRLFNKYEGGDAPTRNLPQVRVVRKLVECVTCKRRLQGKPRYPGDLKSGWDCPRHKCFDGRMQTTIGRLVE